ncbi:MAG: HPP family protein [Planctomycetaceae bacterium]
MTKLTGRLGSLRARDLMTKNLIVIHDTDTIEQAVSNLKSHQITGAPVVNKSGRFVGILSLSDLVAAGIESRGNGRPSAHWECSATWDLFDMAPSPIEQGIEAELVSARMSAVVTSVTDDAPLVEVARVMCNGHWHRVPVVDGKGSLVGIISTMDVLAALVNTAEERD